MTPDDASADLKRQADMEADRANFDALRQDVADHLLPRQADFLNNGGAFSPQMQGTRRTAKIFDETAMLAHDRGVAVCEGYAIPRGTRWQQLAPRDEELAKIRHVREWYESKTALLFGLRSAPYSGFDTQAHESFASLLAFGDQSMFVELRRDKMGRPLGLFYRSEHIGSIWIREDAWGRVDTTHRKFRLSARQAYQRWPDAPPESAKRAMAGTAPKPDEMHEYLHIIEPNADYQEGRIDHKGKPWASRYVDVSAKCVFDVGGYRTLPRAYSRYEKSPFETYGRGPGITVLPAVRACQQMMRDLITAGEFNARPTLLAEDDDLDGLIQYFAGGVVYGGLRNGQRAVEPLFEGIDISQARELLQDTRLIIQQAFFNDLFLVQQGELKSHVSAAAIMERAQEKGLLLAPIGRQETEWFGPMADREIDLMDEMGLLDDMPPEVVEAGGSYQLRYDNPLARAQKAEQAGGFFQLLQGVTPIIQAKPQLIDEFLVRYPFDKLLEGLGWIFAVPAAWEADEQTQAQSKQAIAGDAQAQQLLAAAPVVADVAEKLGRAGGGNALAA